MTWCHSSSRLATMCFIGVLICSCDGPSRCSWTEEDGDLLHEFLLKTTAEPAWSDTVTDIERHPLALPPRQIPIYLDASRPIGGFLPFQGLAMNEFRTVVQWIPDHLLRVYGRPEVVLHWYDVGAEIGPPSDPANPPKLDRPRFSATASRLDLALETMLSQLEAGTVEVAALVTDLVGTGESTGAVAVSKHLRGWLKSVDVRTGRHHLALVGVKGRYVGATHPTCPVRNGLACRFSERRGGYLRLERAASVPFYVLIVGADDERVNEVAQTLYDDATEQGYEAMVELLTRGARSHDTTMTCQAFPANGNPPDKQYALFRKPDGQYNCARDDMVRLGCIIDGFNPQSAQGLGVNEGFRVAATETEVTVDVNCAVLRKASPLPSLHLEVLVTPEKTDAALPEWDDWSTPTDETPESVGKTLQLKYFIDEVRLLPAEYELDLPPLLVGAQR